MAAPRTPAFRPLLSYEVNSTSDVLRRSASMRFRREHDVSLMEWRTLALIEYLQPVALRDLVAYSSTDKAQISRIVTGLVERGFAERRADAADARSARIKLTAAGRRIVKGLGEAARDRDRVLRSALTQAEIDQLVSSLAKLKAKAQELVASEEALQAGGQA
ncbi:MarR family winged helix-turn-helix transcriptional regulator [Variovorax terrae]|uniref:MarR family winged helix-turn-helix transcriptional regulator n=1 Tax=Variovorax terrae TaxID=2923278 RepID=A0A9X1VST3_9BURK|nr:MarR family winged helix-turn-helix transcriptional regulator [Variovorax terrae]MCJ0762730.1 MarR family winged helix-turn-helix transcriptional regulator [Variovorax terrae]